MRLGLGFISGFAAAWSLIWTVSAKPIEVGVVIGIERTGMGFNHERLDVDHADIDDVGWAYHYCEELKKPSPWKGKLAH